MKSKSWSCPFCGSSKRIIKTPYMDRVTGEHKTTFCCQKQAKNSEYLDNKYYPDGNNVPTIDEVAKL